MKQFIGACLIILFGILVGWIINFGLTSQSLVTIDQTLSDQTFANKEITKEQYEFVLELVKKYPEIRPIVRRALDKDKKITNNSYYVIMRAMKEILDRQEKKDKHEIDI